MADPIDVLYMENHILIQSIQGGIDHYFEVVERVKDALSKSDTSNHENLNKRILLALADMSTTVAQVRKACDEHESNVEKFSDNLEELKNLNRLLKNARVKSEEFIELVEELDDLCNNRP